MKRIPTLNGIKINNIYDDPFSGKLGDHYAIPNEPFSNKDILYFPSYEMVMNNKNAWMDDLRHVKGEFAHKIIDYLIKEIRSSD